MVDAKRKLPEDSDELLERARDVRETEQQRRDEPISSPEFHRVAEDVTRKSRQIFYAASREEEDGNHTERGDESIDDIDEEQTA